MTQEALKLALADAKRNERHNNVAETRYWLNQYKLIAEQAIAELESQEPVAYINVEKRILEWAKLIRWETPTIVNLPKIPLYTHPPQRTEQNFCSRCGKRTNDIHTCTPPQIKTTDKFESAKVEDYNRGWNDCFFAFGIVKQSQRTWVGLTDEEVNEIYISVEEKVNEHWESGGTTMMFPSTLYKAIEAKLKQKNGYFEDKNT